VPKDLLHIINEDIKKDEKNVVKENTSDVMIRNILIMLIHNS
jgi:hypothetical protein